MHPPYHGALPVLSLPPLPCSFYFSYSFFFLSHYANADKPVQDRQWYMWLLLSPTCVMELKGCCLCLEREMLSGAIWSHCLWRGAQQGVSDSLFDWVCDTREEIFLKENWSTMTNHVFLPCSQPYSQVAIPISFIALWVYSLVGSPLCGGDLPISLPMKGHCEAWLLQ